ncbi:MAG: hypothetical protein FIO02_12560 [Nitrosopumilales archaeon]|nr:hypothetical protein [Nitrosopumilales archaeon]
MYSVIWIIAIMTSMIGMFLIANPNTANASSCSQQAAINGAQEQSVSSQGSCSILSSAQGNPVQAAGVFDTHKKGSSCTSTAISHAGQTFTIGSRRCSSHSP